MTTGDWRTTALLREALFNTLGRGSRQAILVAVALALGLASALASAFVENELARDDLAREQAGYGVFQIGSASDSDDARILRASCEALIRHEGVRRAGVIVPLDREAFVQTGRAPTALVSTTLLPALAEVDAVVGRDLVVGGEAEGAGSSGVAMPAGVAGAADETGRVVGGPAPWWLASGGRVISARIGEIEPQGIDLGSVVSFPADVDRAPVCIVEVEDSTVSESSARVIASELVARLQTEGPDVRALPVEAGGNSLREVWNASPARAFPAGSGVVGALAAGFVLLLRSSEMAAYRLSGTSARSLLRLLFLEQTVLAGCLVFAAGTGFAALKLIGAVAPPSGFLWALVGGVVWLIVSSASAAVAACRNPIRLARDR